ncbi:Inner membrane protein yejM [Kluyvera cryocrescens]|uniref:Inner membrane protein yejM n=1 Tax=Kluyvera cryocrescens TaxID=580 RepID=A0A485BXN1_KLUCR|nr:Inner membrane protein yejM [Kluyvera cryocrescens]
MQTASQWINWLQNNAQDENRWFSWVSFNGTTVNTTELSDRQYSRAAADVDTQVGRVLDALRESGKLDDTVVIITAGHGIALNNQTSNSDWSRARLQVPLVIHWPGTPAQRIDMLTDHKDIMTTLMQRLLHVSTPANEYSQGAGSVQCDPSPQLGYRCG